MKRKARNASNEQVCGFQKEDFMELEPSGSPPRSSGNRRCGRKSPLVPTLPLRRPGWTKLGASWSVPRASLPQLSAERNAPTLQCKGNSPECCSAVQETHPAK